jgi:ribosomal protein S18 acetylase RimI-like enzyme
MNIKIRRAKINDLKRVIYITKRAYASPHKKGDLVTRSNEPLDVLDMFLNKRFGVIVAIHEDKIIGAIRYRVLDGKRLYFYKLAVLKGYRGNKIASRLVRRVEKIATKMKCKKIFLDCAKEKALPEYYQGHGYKIDRVKKHQNHHDVYMSKKI